VHDFQLERLVWRYQHKQITDAELEYNLREEARRLGEEFASRQPQRALVRRWNSGLIKQFEQERSQAYKLFDRRDYAEALHQLRAAASSLVRMALLLQADARIKEAETDAAQLLKIIELKSLRRLPTVSSITRMLRLAKRFMYTRQYQQAGFVAHFCHKQCAPLLHEEKVSAEQERQLSERLTGIENICAAVAPWIPDSAEESRAMRERLQRLLADGWLTLTTGLMNDCEIWLAQRRRFHEAYQRALAARSFFASTEAQTEIDNLSRQQRWYAASRRLHEMELADCASRLRLVQTRAEELRSRLAPPEAANQEDKDAEVKNGQPDNAAKSV
jgi:hypothetical protein